MPVRQELIQFYREPVTGMRNPSQLRTEIRNSGEPDTPVYQSFGGIRNPQLNPRIDPIA